MLALLRSAAEAVNAPIQVQHKPLEAVKAMSVGSLLSSSVVRIWREGRECDVTLTRVVPPPSPHPSAAPTSDGLSGRAQHVPPATSLPPVTLTASMSVIDAETRKLLQETELDFARFGGQGAYAVAAAAPPSTVAPTLGVAEDSPSLKSRNASAYIEFSADGAWQGDLALDGYDGYDDEETSFLGKVGGASERWGDPATFINFDKKDAFV